MEIKRIKLYIIYSIITVLLYLIFPIKEIQKTFPIIEIIVILAIIKDLYVDIWKEEGSWPNVEHAPIVLGIALAIHLNYFSVANWVFWGALIDGIIDILLDQEWITPRQIKGIFGL